MLKPKFELVLENRFCIKKDSNQHPPAAFFGLLTTTGAFFEAVL